jgi:type I restriction enzyme R subunit
LNVAFLIDEAHRAQAGQRAHDIKAMFNKPDEEDTEQDDTTVGDEIETEIEKRDISSQLFVCFTATPTTKTVMLFGDPFDVYTEDEAIKEGYILDVINRIVSYKTLYNIASRKILHDKDRFPKGLLSKPLRGWHIEILT